MEIRELALSALTVAYSREELRGLGSWSRPSRVTHVPVHHRVSEHAGDPAAAGDTLRRQSDRRGPPAGAPPPLPTAACSHRGPDL